MSATPSLQTLFLHVETQLSTPSATLLDNCILLISALFPIEQIVQALFLFCFSEKVFHVYKDCPAFPCNLGEGWTLGYNDIDDSIRQHSDAGQRQKFDAFSRVLFFSSLSGR